MPTDAEVVDGTGKFVTPGVIDTHSHLGVYAAPGVEAHSDGNEATNPSTPEVWAEHSVWPQDPQFPRNLAGGVTTIQMLPGSANLIGGRGVVLKVVPARSVQEMKFPGAKYGLKMACGENPKRVYEQRGPSTRMGNVAGYRAAWIKAERYRRKWDKWIADQKGDPPERDLALETLAEVLRGNILVQNHCYRADEMVQMIDIAKEFGYKIRSFHHAVEAYKIADLLAREGISASMWADWGGFKMEAADGIKANAAFVHAAGGRAVIHSDDPSGSQRLNQEAAKAMAAGNAAGMRITPDEALKWFTANAAWTLGLEDRIGTIETGKNADLVLWSGHPFSVYTRAERSGSTARCATTATRPSELADGFRAGLRADARKGTVGHEAHDAHHVPRSRRRSRGLRGRDGRPLGQPDDARPLPADRPTAPQPAARRRPSPSPAARSTRSRGRRSRTGRS